MPLQADGAAELTLPPEYDFIGHYGQERVFVNRGGRWTQRSTGDVFLGGRWGLANARTGELLHPLELAAVEPFQHGHAIVTREHKLGLLDTAGQWVLKARYAAIEPVYTEAGEQRRWTGFYKLKRDGRWGWYDAAAGQQVACQFRALKWWQGSGPAPIAVQGEAGWHYRHPDGERLHREAAGPAQAHAGEAAEAKATPAEAVSREERGPASASGWVTAFPMRDSIALVRGPGGFGLIGASGQMLEPSVYTNYLQHEGRPVLVQEPVASQTPFRGGLAGVRISGAWGLMDTAGRLLLAPRFGYCEPQPGGWAIVQQGGAFGLIDTTGRWRLRPRYDDLRLLNGGAACALRSGEWRFVAAGDTSFGPARYSYLSNFGSELIAFQRQGKLGLMTPAGELRLRARYDRMDQRSVPLLLPVRAGRRYVANAQGRLIDSTGYQQIGAFEYGTLAPVQREGRWGLIDTLGRLVLAPRFAAIKLVAPGRLAARRPAADHWALYDTTGRRLSPARYQTIGYFPLHSRSAPCRRNGRWGLLRRDGTAALPPHYTSLESLTLPYAPVGRE
jgi:hypothetical protein